MKTLEEVYERGVSLGMCQDGRDGWSADPEQLIELYKLYIDFCISNHYPDLEWVRSNFPQDLLSKHGVYLSGSHSLKGPFARRIVVGGDARVLIEARDFDIFQIYAAGDSLVDVVCGDYSRISAWTYDDCSFKINAKDFSTAYVYYNGGNAKVEGHAILRK